MFDIPDPWGESAPAYQTNSDLITPCLNNVLLQPIYNDAFKFASQDSLTVSRSSFSSLLGGTDLQDFTKKQIVFIAFQNNPMELSKQNFFIAIALIALAQKGHDVSIQTLEKFKNMLPEPKLHLEAPQEATILGPDTNIDHRSSFSEFEAYSELSPNSRNEDTFARGPSFSTDSNRSPYTESPADQNSGHKYSNYDTSDDHNPFDNTNFNESATTTTNATVNTHTNMYGSSSSNSPYGQNSLEPRESSQPIAIWKLVDEDKEQYDLLSDDIKIDEDPNRAGLVFKRINYNVSSKFFNSKVVRRYNDFFSLSTYLGKKYYYRMLPLIPPKGFPDNRLRGLANFSCAIMRLPYIRKDEIVKVFFTKNEDITKDLKLALNDVKLENCDLKELAKDIPEKSIQLLHESIQLYAKAIQEDFDKLYKLYTSLEKISKYKNVISDEILAISEVFRPHNMPLEPELKQHNYYKSCKSEKKLNKLFSELSMNMSDISLLEKSMSEVMISTTQEHIKRYISLVYSMKLLVDRIISFNKAPEALSLEERIISHKEQIYTLGESNANDFAKNRLQTLLINDTQALKEIKYEESLAKIMLFHESERYRRYKSFNAVVFKKVANDYIRHHSLMLNSWQQVLSTTELMPSSSSQFID